MSRTRLALARHIVRFEPTREKFEAELPAIYGYVPHILEILLADVKLEIPKIVYGYQEYFVSTKTEINQNIIGAINYKLVKPGEIIQINSPSFSRHGYKMCVRSKSNLNVKGYLVDEPNVNVRISANSILFLPPSPTSKTEIQTAKEQFKVGSLCLISSDNFRPRYEIGDIFRIVSAGFKYVRVEPVNPKFKLWKRKPGKPEKKINEFTYEIGYSENGREFYYGTSVYNMDIPYMELKNIQEVFGEEVGTTIHDFAELGI
jgi:hypothetical protein